MADYEGCHFNGPWMIICATPDVCNTLIGGTPVPVPYSPIAWGDATGSHSANVNFKTYGAFHSPSFTVCCKNDEPGTAGGVVSGVNVGVCYEFTHSIAVNVNSQPVIRDGDVAWMNARDRQSPGNAMGVILYPAGWLLAQFADALQEGTDAWVKILEKVDPRFGPILRAPPEPPLSAAAGCWEGLKAGTVGGVEGFAEEKAAGAVGGVLDVDVFTGKPVGTLGKKAGEAAVGALGTIGSYDDYMDSMARNETGKANCQVLAEILTGAALSKVRISRKGKGGTGKSKRKPSAKAKRRQKEKARRKANRVRQRRGG